MSRIPITYHVALVCDEDDLALLEGNSKVLSKLMDGDLVYDGLDLDNNTTLRIIEHRLVDEATEDDVIISISNIARSDYYVASHAAIVVYDMTDNLVDSIYRWCDDMISEHHDIPIIMLGIRPTTKDSLDVYDTDNLTVSKRSPVVDYIMEIINL